MQNDHELDDPWPFQRELGLQTHKMLSVTGIMRRAGMVQFHVHQSQLAKLAHEGRDVHQVIEDIAKKKVQDYWSNLPTVAGYAEGWNKFVSDFDYQPVLVEEKLVHPFLGYLGRLDQAGVIFCSSPKRKRAVIIDVKRGAPAPSHRYQTAAYAELVNRSKYNTHVIGTIVERYCVYLHHGGYWIQKYDRLEDFAEFTALLTTARLRQHYGLVNERDERRFDYILRHSQELYDVPRL